MLENNGAMVVGEGRHVIAVSSGKHIPPYKCSGVSHKCFNGPEFMQLGETTGKGALPAGISPGFADAFLVQHL